MLKKKERLTKHEFDRFFSIGKRLHSPSLQLIFAPSSEFHGAVVVGKKVYRNAVDRNRLRRRLYAVLYEYNKKHPASFVYILIAKPPLSRMSKTECSSEVRQLLDRLPKV